MAAGALAVILPAAASRREFFPLCLVLPLQGSVTFLAFVPQLEALSESLTHSIPRSFLVVALSASAVGFADALWLYPERALVGPLTYPSPGSMFEPSCFGRLLCHEAGLTSRLLLALPGLCLMPDLQSRQPAPEASSDRHSVALALSSSL